MSEVFLFFILFNLISACLITIGQWLVLRTFSIKLYQWFLCTVPGIFISSIIGYSITVANTTFEYSESYHQAIITALIYTEIMSGVFVGISQTFVLRRYFKGAILWIPANIIGYLFAVIFFSPEHIFGGSFIFNGFLFGVVLSLFTGYAFFLLIKQNYSYNSNVK